ncbi:MAG: hypothetical protein Q7O04_04840 [Candidatus Omnitrophota bacterium]|nr:hypothetical protein [Candidatus Omnitrophota bacterium]
MATTKIALVMLIMVFASNGVSYSADKNEEMRQYMIKIDPVLTNIQITSRSISQKILSLEAATKHIKEYIVQLRAIEPPAFMAKQHKMILLSFYKMKAGFIILSKGDRPGSMPLVKKGAELLKIAANDIVDFAKKEGLVKAKAEEKKK